MSGTPTYTGTVYKESEKARENAFFSKQDEMALRKLLTKVKSSADAGCATAGAHSAKEEAALKAIVGKYKLDEKDMEGTWMSRGRAAARAMRLGGARRAWRGLHR
jgi:phosphoribosylformylglycinamidine (FGAM) synthase-like enzyme